MRRKEQANEERSRQGRGFRLSCIPDALGPPCLSTALDEITSAMPNDDSQRLTKVLEEIRDVLKESNEAAAERHRAREEGQRRRARSLLLLFCIFIASWLIYAFWISPMQQQKQLDDWRSMQSNSVSHAP
jgi:hypothetical protein